MTSFYWSLRDSKSPQVFRILLCILADRNNAVVWMVSTCPLISKFSSPFTNTWVIVLSVSIPIGITATFMFHSFLSFLARSRYLSLFSLSLNYILWSAEIISIISFPFCFYIFYLFESYGQQAILSKLYTPDLFYQCIETNKFMVCKTIYQSLFIYIYIEREINRAIASKRWNEAEKNNIFRTRSM